MRWQRILRGMCLAVGLQVGCAHEVESPSVSAEDQLEPDLVCNAQLTTPVDISGSGFTPLPTQVLQDEEVLVLPSVELVLTHDLDGEELASDTSDPVLLSGDPREENADNLTWHSSKHMTARLDEALELDPGIYQLTVTNPDGKATTRVAEAVAVVPPPRIGELQPNALCDDQEDQTLVLVGETFLRVGTTMPTVQIVSADGAVSEEFEVEALDDCSSIPGREPAVEQCTSATITIPAQTLEPGEYEVTITNPEPANCVSSNSLTLTVNPPPEVEAVVPSTVCSGGSMLDITGQYFQDGATVELRCGDADPIVSQSTDVLDESSMTATFGPGAEPGVDCDVVVINPDLCEDRPLPHEVVTGTEGPILFFVDPPVVYSGINTRVTLYLTAVEGDFTVQIEPADGSGDPTELTATLVAGHDNRVQATIPAGTAAGSYDIIVSDETRCAARLQDGLTITDDLTLDLDSIVPPFGHEPESTPVSIFRDTSGSVDFSPTPRVFLNPSTDDTAVAIQVTGISFVDSDGLTAVVPADTPAGTYDLVVVNPTGEVGLLEGGYESLEDPPPVIADVVPQSIVAQADQSIELRGTDFVDSTVSVICQDPGGGTSSADVTEQSPTCTASGCTQIATVDGGGLEAGSVCLVRVINDAGSWDEFSAIGVTNSSENLSEPVTGPTLGTARRALVSAAVQATSASRFVYAIAGDTGASGSVLSSVEIAPVDVFGNMSAWFDASESLQTARAYAASATIGRYVYVYGGGDGSDALASGERALVLSPEEVPVIEDVDLCLGGGDQPCFDQDGIGDGLAPGVYSYRVAAIIDDADPVNLGGETLASDPITLKLSEIGGRRISVELSWSAPVDAAGDELSGITGYRIYRTPVDGTAGSDEVLLGEVSDGATLSFVDDGAAALGSASPLPLGSTSAWQALPDLGVARAGAAGAAIPDPSDPTVWYVYALLGKDSGAETGGTELGSYEFLTVTIQANGRQTVATSWTAGTSSATPRWQAGAWVVDSVVQPLVGTDTYLYLGGGRLGDDSTEGMVEAGIVAPGGDLGTFDPSPEDFTSVRSGYGVAAAARRLFVFGGRASQITANAQAALVDPVPDLAANAWNNEGLQLAEADGRYLMGSAIQSAFIFLVGGETRSGVTDSTELVIW